MCLNFRSTIWSRDVFLCRKPEEEYELWMCLACDLKSNAHTCSRGLHILHNQQCLSLAHTLVCLQSCSSVSVYSFVTLSARVHLSLFHSFSTFSVVSLQAHRKKNTACGLTLSPLAYTIIQTPTFPPGDYYECMITNAPSVCVFVCVCEYVWECMSVCVCVSVIVCSILYMTDDPTAQWQSRPEQQGLFLAQINGRGELPQA